MIRYAISAAELEAAIEKEKVGWLAKARLKTEAFRAAKKFNETDSQNTWSQIKPVFMKLQHDKCAFCERKLGAVVFGKGEHDVEHFRPKRRVIAWPTPKMIEEDQKKPANQRRFPYAFKTGTSDQSGYYLLAYSIFNYATSCKSCNSSLKSDYFPIAAKRQTATDDAATLKTEKPLLVYPIGNADDDPEELITYFGFLPVPKNTSTSSFQYRRARVTIDFFQLDNREDLLRIRALIITNMWFAFEILSDPQTPPDRHKKAKRILKLALADKSEQTACARAFHEVCQTNPAQARQFNDLAEQYLDNN